MKNTALTSYSRRMARAATQAASLLVFLLPLLTETLLASAGTSAANFLKIGTGARGSAMGDAQSAVADDVTAAYWNPAGLSQLRFQELSLMHYNLVEGVRYQQAAYGFPSDKGVFAFGINRLDYGSIQGYDAGSLPTSQVEASNLLLQASWSKKLMDKSPLAGGVTVKYLQSELAGYKANAPMADIGLLYPFTEGRLRGLRLAAAVRHIGPGVKYDSESSPLPQQVVVGAGLAALGGNLNLALDAIQPNDSDSYMAAGLEYRVFNMLNLRVGYNSLSNFAGQGITYGMGLKFTQWNIDYALVPLGDLGNTNRISVSIRFGRALQMKYADEQVEHSFKMAERELALGNGIRSYSMLNDLLLIAPWHQPSVELKAKIEKQFDEMSLSKNRAKMEAEIAEEFTAAKASFDRDELVSAKKGFDTILRLQPDHVGSKVYLERIQNRYASLAYESFKEGMDYFAAGDYAKAQTAFEKTLTINPEHADAKAQLQKAKELLTDSARRDQEMTLLSGAADAYRAGLAAYQKNDLEQALLKFEEVKLLMPEYEEVGRYLDVTKKSLSGVLFEQAQVHTDNGQLDESVKKLKRADSLNPGDSRIQAALQIAERDLSLKNSEESKNVYRQGVEQYLGGNTDKAAELWRRALELDPTNDDARGALSKLEEQRNVEKQAQ